MITSKAPDYPFLSILIRKPESKENWLKHIEVARRLEEMFKTK